MILKEDQNPKAYDTKSSVCKADSLNFESKETHQLNFSRRDAFHLTFQVKGGEIYPDSKCVDENSMDDEFKVVDSCRKENPNECSNHSSGQDICISSSELFDAETKLYPDKGVLHSDLPNLIVSQDDINNRVAEDICIDSNVQVEETSLIDCCEDDNKNRNNFEGSDEVEFESSLDNDIPKQSNLERNYGSIDTTVVVSKGDSTIEKMPMHTLGTLESKDKNINQHLDQETLEVNTCESLGKLFEREVKEDKHARSILYDSKVESGTITFNFDSLVESSEQSEDDQKVSTAVNLLDSGQEEWTHSNKTKSNNKSDVNEGISGMSSNLDDDNNSADTSVADRLKRDDAGGESSLSAADDGLLPNSACLSFRSDGSAASTTSFAFPILQTEWNSSPVRMEKVDRRDFRKRRGWRSGLLCCRF